MDRKSIWHRALLYVAMALFLTFMLLPFIEMFAASLRPLSHLFSVPFKFWSPEFSFAAYSDMWVTVPLLPRYILNSVLLATATTIVSLIFIVPATYAYARFRFRGKALSLGLFLAVNMFAGAVLLIPLYKLLRALGLLNTYLAMIVPGAAFLIPTGIWLLKSYIEKIPIELEEAAWVDGASRMYTMRRVILPLAVPGLVVISVATFIGAYAQQFLFALTFNNVREYMPLPVGIYEFIGYQSVKWNEMMAASLVGILPVMVLFFLLQRHLLEGLTAGAVKH